MTRYITGILLLVLSSISFSAEPEGLILYREKMDYWQSRWESAFKCINRYELAMFIYDSTFEEGAHPREVLAEVIENKTLENTGCVIQALRVISPDKVGKIVEHYYRDPLFNQPDVFKSLLESLQS